MAKINKIILKNFRNFNQCEIIFNDKCNILFGNNGSGKTNILESISLINRGRGFRNANIKNLISKGEKNFFIDCLLSLNNNNYNITVTSNFHDNKYKKNISLNDEISKEATNFIEGSISNLLFLPEMERLFLSSPNYRRNFIDKLIFSEKKNYNTVINKYKKYVLERSKILQSLKYDEDWLTEIEKNIATVGIEIYNLRVSLINVLNENLIKINNKDRYPFSITFNISDTFYNNKIDINEYLNNLLNLRNYDAKFGGCKIGPHKSDFLAIINNDFDASQLSTGQQKTIVLMTLIAKCNYLILEKNLKPILLFDEICSHLDEINRKILLDLINDFDIQFFLTGTDKSLFSFISTNAKFYNITDL